MISIGVYEDTPETISVAGEEERLPPMCRSEDGDEPEKDLSSLWPRRAQKGDIVLATGFSLATHAAVLVLAVLLHLLVVPPPEHRGSFITVNLVGPADARTGSDGAQNGSGSESGSPHPAMPGAAGARRDETTLRERMMEPCSLKVEAEMKPEMNLPPALSDAAHSEATPVPTPVPRKSSAQKERKKIVAVRESKPEPPAGVSSVPSAAPPDVHSAGAPSATPDGETSGDGGRGVSSGGKGGHDPSGLSGGESPGGRGHGSNRFELKQVDKAPCPIQKVEPEFPPAARRMGVGGSVVVRFLVKADGSVGEASVVRAEPSGVFERNALEAVGKWRFEPGCYHGKAVATWVVLAVQFRLSK